MKVSEFFRLTLALLLLAPLLLLASPAGAKEKIIILGFDGADPERTQEYMDQGLLPNLSKLAADGSFSSLGTSNPAESPVSWANFASGKGPGHHGIFDFLRRTPGTYFPEIALASATTEPLLPNPLARAGLAFGLGLAAFFLLLGILRLFGRRGPMANGGALILALPVFWLGYLVAYQWVPTELPKAVLNREGTPFWDTAAQEAGIRVTAIDIPVTFPANAAEGVKLTTGLGTPDIRQTWGNWSVYSEQEFESPFSETAGNLKHVDLVEGLGESTVRGPANFMDEDRTEIELPIRFEKIDADRMRIEVQGQSIELGVGEWSDFVSLRFQMNPLIKIIGMTRFKLVDLEPEFHLYQEPLNFHPSHLPPTVNISHPRGYADQLANDYGLRETLGWSIATNPLKDDAIDYGTFLEDLEFTMERREAVVKGELAKGDWDLFMGVFLGSDRMQHMMYRMIDEGHPHHDPELAALYADRVPWVYQQMDRIVGDVLRDYVDENTTLMIISDHGFHSFRWGVNLNTWMVKNGYMALKGMDPDANYQRLEDFFDPEGRFFQNVDWSRTKAYCLGLGSIYMNLRGREREGSINPSEYQSVREELSNALLAMEDPNRAGEPVVRQVFNRDEIFRGPKMYVAPDLFVGFESGYRVSWQTAAGGIPPEIIEDNLNNWSGDHCSVAPDISGGIFFSNRRLPQRVRNIVDIAPTVLRTFGVTPPRDYEGKSLLEN